MTQQGDQTSPQPPQPVPGGPPAAPEAARPGSRRSTLWVNGVLLIPLLILAALLVPWVQHFSACMSYPYQLDAEEGFIFHQAVSMARGESIYRPIDTPPFLVANYPPLYPWLYSLVNGDRIDLRSLPRGRAIVGLATLGAALGLAFILLMTTGRWLPSLLAPLLFLVTYEVNQWVGYARVDLPSVFFTILGLAVFLASRRRWALVVAALLFVCAAWCRQTALLAPAACALALLLKDRRALAWFLVPYAAVGLFFYLWINAATDGQLHLHLVTYNKNVMDWHGWQLVMKNEVWFFFRWLIAAMALGSVLIVLSIRKPPGEQPPSAHTHLLRFIRPRRSRPEAAIVLGLYALFSALSLTAYAKIGAAPNYVLEPLAGAILWTLFVLGFFMNRSEEKSYAGASHPVHRFRFASVALLLAALLAIHSLHILRVSGAVFSSPTPTTADRDRARKVVVSLRNAPGDVLCEEPVLTMLAGKRVLFQPFIMSRLAREGRWDEQLLVDMIDDRKFGLIVVTADLAQGDAATHYQRYTAAMGQSLRQAYRPLGIIQLPGLRLNYFAWAPLAD